MSTRKWLLVIAGAAILIRLVYVLVHDPIPQPYQLDLDEVDFSYLGKSVSEGRGLVDKQGDPTTTRFPFYPYVLGLVYFVFGYHTKAAFIFQAVLGGILPLLAYYICREYFSRRIALLAAGIAALYPSYIEFSQYLMSENLFIPEIAFLIFISLKLLKKPDWKKAFCLGLALGITSLTRGTAFLLVFIAPLVIVLAIRRKFVIRLRLAAVTVAAAVLVFIPWMIRNYHAYGKWLMSSSGGGPVLWLGYFPIPPGDFFQIDRAYAYVDSVGRDQAKLEEFHRILMEDNLFGTIGMRWFFVHFYPDREFSYNEVELDNQVKKLLIEELKSNPKIIVIKHIKEVLRFWHFVSARGDYIIAYGLILPFFLGGLWLLRKRWKEYWLLGLFFLYIWLIEIIFMSATRYRLPFEVIMIVIGAYALNEFFTRVRPIYIPLTLTTALAAVNLYFSINDYAFRGTIRYIVKTIGIPVMKNDASNFPQVGAGKQDSSGEQTKEPTRQ